MGERLPKSQPGQSFLDGFVRLNLDGLLPGLARFVGLFERRINVAEVIVKRGIRLFGIIERFEHIRQRFFGFFQLEEDPAKAIEEGGVLGFLFDGLFNHLPRLREVDSPLGPHIAEIVQRFGKIGRERQAFFEIILGHVELLDALVGRAKLIIKNMRQPIGIGGPGDDFGPSKCLMALVYSFIRE